MTEALDQAFQNAVGRLARLDDAGGDAQVSKPKPIPARRSTSRSADAQSPARELVLDQAVGGGGIGHPQQRLCQHHQRQALPGGERIGVQEILDSAQAAGCARMPSISRPARASIRSSAVAARGAAASNRLRSPRPAERRVRQRYARTVGCGDYRRSSAAPTRPVDHNSGRRGSAEKLRV